MQMSGLACLWPGHPSQQSGKAAAWPAQLAPVPAVARAATICEGCSWVAPQCRSHVCQLLNAMSATVAALQPCCSLAAALCPAAKRCVCTSCRYMVASAAFAAPDLSRRIRYSSISCPLRPSPLRGTSLQIEGHVGDKPGVSAEDTFAWAFPALRHSLAGGAFSNLHPDCMHSDWSLSGHAAPACKQLASQQQALHATHLDCHTSSLLPLPDSYQLTLAMWCMHIGQLAAPQQEADAHVLTWGGPARQR